MCFVNDRYVKIDLGEFVALRYSYTCLLQHLLRFGFKPANFAGFFLPLLGPADLPYSGFIAVTGQAVGRILPEWYDSVLVHARLRISCCSDCRLNLSPLSASWYCLCLLKARRWRQGLWKKPGRQPCPLSPLL